MNDPIADLLTQIRNAYTASKLEVDLPSSIIKQQIATKLQQAGYLATVSVLGDAPKQTLHLTLRYHQGQPLLTHIQRISKPSVRHYAKKGRIPKALSGHGVTLLTTSKGILTDKEANSAGIGGEIICKIW